MTMMNDDDDDGSENEGDDNIDDKSVSTTETHPPKSEQPRDEVEEIRKQTLKESTQVRNWRILVALALLVTAVVVTSATYYILEREEQQNFRNIFFQFAGTLADAAIEQRRDLKHAFHTLSDTVSVSAELASGSSIGGSAITVWPYFFPPKFESYAEDYMAVSSTESVDISNIVRRGQRNTYVNFSTSVYQDAVAEAHMLKYGNLDHLNTDTTNYFPHITKRNNTQGDHSYVEDDERDVYFVQTVKSPPPKAYGPQINWNIGSDDSIRRVLDALLVLQNETVYSDLRTIDEEEHEGHEGDDDAHHPHAFVFHPVYLIAGDSQSGVVAIVSSAMAFDTALRNLLTDDVKGMLCVVKNNCGQTMSYVIDGSDAIYQGMTDLHDHKYRDESVTVGLDLHANPYFTSTPGHCMYSMTIYPTQKFEDDHKSDTPAVFAAIVAVTFLLVAAAFVVYDVKVMRRNELMIAKMAASNAVLGSLIPSHIRDRLLLGQENNQKQGQRDGEPYDLNSFLHEGSTKGIMSDPERSLSAPLADLYLDTTVLNADIVGFTAWTSVREPTQVFMLLESLFQSFDKIARKRRIFKVETTGDCYVAVAGLPDPRKDHAVAMARFARDILGRMHLLTKELETVLGPDTSDLCLRIGMHSGPVTAGVLRGERSRFQLFGDTVNICSKLEATSMKNRIQCSKETADLLTKEGKGSWVQKRPDLIALSSNTFLEAYWVLIKGERAGSLTSGPSSQVESSTTDAPSRDWLVDVFPGLGDRTQRLIGWNVEMLLRLLKEMVANRSESVGHLPASQSTLDGETEFGRTIPLEEVQEIIALPEYAETCGKQRDPGQIEIPKAVAQQLHRYVSAIASLYKPNPFHNFDHASHVVMSVIKLMSRIVAPKTHNMDCAFGNNDDPSSQNEIDKVTKNAAETLHDHTYGITSDPLTQFACAYAALIHDVDHDGVSNAQLVKEGVPIAKQYKERSVAEQNSLDISWDLLMRPEYETLRRFLFPTREDLVRFRKLVVNVVMATDIVDQELKNLRNGRWNKAFKKGDYADFVDSKRDEVNRKATIVIEHIIQASDISHTMQHWHVYTKWNQYFFNEMYVAYLKGRFEKDPATFWYKGEFGFFDFYIIPLAKKLKECGVFGVSSGEYLNYAQSNRLEWEAHGEEVVARMVEEARKKYGVKGTDGSIIDDKRAPTTTADLELLTEIEV